MASLPAGWDAGASQKRAGERPRGLPTTERQGGTLVGELAKCDPFCASHHFLLTQAKREGWERKPYEELLDMLREQWRETMKAAGLRYDTPTGEPPSRPGVDLATIDPPPAVDAAPSWAKLTWEQVRELRRRHQPVASRSEPCAGSMA